jgi:predicted ATPase
MASESEAIILFVQRAQAVKPDFHLTAANIEAVVDICRWIDGLPLAIELAAARVKTLSPQAILARLSNRLQLLVRGARDLPERHQTLRRAIEWSYDLLDPATQTLLRHLAVFVGGFTLEGAEAMERSGAPPVLDLLGVLVDESLLWTTEQADGERRFGMLESVREYALERLEIAEEERHARRRHAEYFLGLLCQADPWQSMTPQLLDRLQIEHDNLRATLA